MNKRIPVDRTQRKDVSREIGPWGETDKMITTECLMECAVWPSAAIPWSPPGDHQLITIKKRPCSQHIFGTLARNVKQLFQQITVSYVSNNVSSQDFKSACDRMTWFLRNQFSNWNWNQFSHSSFHIYNLVRIFMKLISDSFNIWLM